MTTDAASGLSQDVQDELADFFDAGANPDWRANLPAGTVLAETEVDGARHRFIKGKSGVHANGMPLPERTPVYDTRTGALSMVPTGQLGYQLSKRRDDGSRVYSRRVPAGIVSPEPIEDTCLICLRARNGVKRNFYSEDALLVHYQVMHTLEWGAMERDRDIKARREDSNRLERLITTLAAALRPDLTASLPADVREQIETLQGAVKEKPSVRSRS